MNKLTRRDFIKAAVMGVVGAVGAMFLPKLNQKSEIVKMAEDTARLIPPGKDPFDELIQGVKRQTYDMGQMFTDPYIDSDDDYEEDDQVQPDTEKGKFIWVNGMVRYDCASGNYALQCYSLEDEG